MRTDLLVRSMAVPARPRRNRSQRSLAFRGESAAPIGAPATKASWIEINFPFEVCLNCGSVSETLYGLRQAAVVPAAWTDEDLENALGEVGAEMLSRFMADAASVGVGWGVTVSAVVRHYPAQPVAGSLVVGLLGGQPQLSGVNPGEIAKGLSRKLGGECYTVPAPCFVNSKETRTILLGQPSIRQTLELAERVDLALVGVGPPATARRW